MSPPPPIHLLDGALGTLLPSISTTIHYSPATPLWSSHLLTTPSGESILSEAHRRYVGAGAEILLSATYQASLEGFARTGRDAGSASIGEDDARRMMRRAVGIAREAFAGADPVRGKVALSLGAYGASMIPSTEFTGAYDGAHQSVGALRDWHLRRLDAFCPFLQKGQGTEGVREEEDKIECWKNVDRVVFETLPVRNEILAAREAMGSITEGPGRRPFWISCVFPGEGFALPDGSDVRQVVRAMLGDHNDIGGGEGEIAVPAGIGINCTRVSKIEKLIRDMEEAVEQIFANRNETWPALVVYPDGTMGEVYNTATKEWERPEGAAESKVPWDATLFSIVARARDRGKWKEIIVGGCCQTTPDDIGNLRKRINGLSTTT